MSGKSLFDLLYRRLGTPQGRSVRVRKFSPHLPEFDTRTVQARSESLYRPHHPGPRMSFVPVDVSDCVTRREYVCEKQLATRRNCQCSNLPQSCCVQQHAAFKNSEYLCEFGVYFFGGGRGGSFRMEVLRIENKSQ